MPSCLSALTDMDNHSFIQMSNKYFFNTYGLPYTMLGIEHKKVKYLVPVSRTFLTV